MRFDRCLTLSVFQPLRCAVGGKITGRVPVLMYHSVSDDTEENVRPYYRLATNPLQFAEQMEWLRDSGYTGVSLEEVLAVFASGDSDKRKLAVITFDDGFRNFHTNAWPVLKRYDFSATMYLPTAFIAAERKSFCGRECLTWDEVRELRRAGIRFGSHTVSHPKLYELAWDAIERELALSKKSIGQELGEEITSFAYPYAYPHEDRSFTKQFTKLLRGLGYQNCATTVIGRVQADDDLFCLKRLPANSCDDQALFTAKLAGDYDWLAFLQRSVRTLKRLGLKKKSRRAA